MNLEQALQAHHLQASPDTLDAIIETLITQNIYLLSDRDDEQELGELLNLPADNGESALAIFSTQALAAALQKQLKDEGLGCFVQSVPGYWPLLEDLDCAAILIDPGCAHGLCLPESVLGSLRPVIEELLSADDA